MIAVAGCVAQAEGEEIMARAPSVSMVVGPQAYHRLPEMLARAVGGERVTDTDMPAQTKFDALPARRKVGPSAFLTVQEGCDKFCTYCVVPYTRGAEVSRPFAGPDRGSRAAGRCRRARDHAARPERQRLDGRGRQGPRARSGRADPRTGGDARSGAPALYHQPPRRHDRGPDRGSRRGRKADAVPSLAGAIGQRPRARGDEPQPHRRQLYAHSRSRARGAPRHRAFGRFHRRLSRARPTPNSRTRCALVDAVGYAQCFSFKYSARPGTPAADMEGQIAPEVMDERLARLQDALNRHQLAFNAGEPWQDLRGAGRARGAPSGADARQIAVAAIGAFQRGKRHGGADRRLGAGRTGRGRSELYRRTVAGKGRRLICKARRRGG